GQLDVLQLDQRDLYPPVLGLDVEDLADALVELLGVGQGFVERVPADDGAQGRLCDLVDGGGDVLDRDDGSDRIDDLVVGDSRYVDRDVVAGDDALRLDRHRHDAQRNTVDPVDERDDHDQSRAERVVPDFAEPELHGPLVLLQDVDRRRRQEHGDDYDDGDDDETSGHCFVLLDSGSTVIASATPRAGNRPALLRTDETADRCGQKTRYAREERSQSDSGAARRPTSAA